jgi:hypothetical protein
MHHLTHPREPRGKILSLLTVPQIGKIVLKGTKFCWVSKNKVRVNASRETSCDSSRVLVFIMEFDCIVKKKN